LFHFSSPWLLQEQMKKQRTGGSQPEGQEGGFAPVVVDEAGVEAYDEDADNARARQRPAGWLEPREEKPNEGALDGLIDASSDEEAEDDNQNKTDEDDEKKEKEDEDEGEDEDEDEEEDGKRRRRKAVTPKLALSRGGEPASLVRQCIETIATQHYTLQVPHPQLFATTPLKCNVCADSARRSSPTVEGDVAGGLGAGASAAVREGQLALASGPQLRSAFAHDRTRPPPPCANASCAANWWSPTHSHHLLATQELKLTVKRLPSLCVHQIATVMTYVNL
jgi:hypothetical protein